MTEENRNEERLHGQAFIEREKELSKRKGVQDATEGDGNPPALRESDSVNRPPLGEAPRMCAPLSSERGAPGGENAEIMARTILASLPSPSDDERFHHSIGVLFHSISYLGVSKVTERATGDDLTEEMMKDHHDAITALRSVEDDKEFVTKISAGLGSLAPKGTWLAEILENIWRAKDRHEATDIANAVQHQIAENGLWIGDREMEKAAWGNFDCVQDINTWLVDRDLLVMPHPEGGPAEVAKNIIASIEGPITKLTKLESQIRMLFPDVIKFLEGYRESGAISMRGRQLAGDVIADAKMILADCEKKEQP